VDNDPPAPPAVLQLRPRRVLIAMLAVLVFLAAMHASLLVVPWLVSAHHPLWGLPRLFDLAGEGNLAAYWSTACLLFGAALLALVAVETRRLGRPFVRHWFVLAAAFLFLSLDEAAQIHEGVIARIWVEHFGRGHGIFYYVWYLPILPVVAIAFLLYLPFLRHLERRFLLRVVAAGALYLGGAVGGDMVESWIVDAGRSDATVATQLVEESLEIGGATLFDYALLSLLASLNASLLVGVGPERRGGAIPRSGV